MKIQHRRGGGPMTTATATTATGGGLSQQLQPNIRTGISSSTTSSSSSYRGRFNNTFSRRKGIGTGGTGTGGTGINNRWKNIIIMILVISTILLVTVRVFFPTQILLLEVVEKQGHTLAQKALDMEKDVVEGWFVNNNHHLQQDNNKNKKNKNDGHVKVGDEIEDGVGNSQQGDMMMMETQQQHDRARSSSVVVPPNAATARMEAQSSRWVDGEKALKKKLQVLYDMQQRGQNLGVPVLTRFLGDDFPAWVEPGMDEVEWKNNVQAKYIEMRAEEDVWKMEMQKLIDQRERDIGITTP